MRYSYYTAGSGGAGPTILETSMLLAGEECTVYKGGEAFKLPPISDARSVDFGPGLCGACCVVVRLYVSAAASLLSPSLSTVSFLPLVPVEINTLKNNPPKQTTTTQTKGVGHKTVFLYNLPEVMSAVKYMKVPGRGVCCVLCCVVWWCAARGVLCCAVPVTAV